MTDLVTRARGIADDVLFPAAAEVDAKGEVPRSHFDLLAEQGFYGLAGPVELGGAGADLPQLAAIVEVLAGGCLSTTFTWLQHNGLVAGLARSASPLRERYLDRLIRGEVRAGVAYGGVIPTPPLMRATRVDGGYAFTGVAPFVSGWGLIDVLQLCGRDGDNLISAVVDAAAGPRLVVRRLDLVAVQGTATVALTLDGYFVPEELVYDETPHAVFVAGNSFGARLNGCAHLGLVGRATRLIEQAGQPELAAALRAEQGKVRDELDEGLATGDLARLLEGRAAGAELAYRSAGALVAAVGSRAVLAGEHAQRLVREATFLLVVASRPEIKAGLLARAAG
jgi:alkylation response protein AidB-like acyl-CoA dehydrogenase